MFCIWFERDIHANYVSRLDELHTYLKNTAEQQELMNTQQSFIFAAFLSNTVPHYFDHENNNAAYNICILQYGRDLMAEVDEHACLVSLLKTF